MSYPLIILGAGASYDCVQETRSETGNHFRPPLTKDIFHKNFEDIINKHKRSEKFSLFYFIPFKGREKILNQF